jgi:hypothetical protein
MTTYAPQFPDGALDTPDESGERSRSFECANDATTPATTQLQRQWAAASEILGMRIAEVRSLWMDVRKLDSSVADWWIDDLDGVNQALDELRARALHAPAHMIDGPRAPLAAYLTAAYVWCGDIARDVNDSIRARQRGAERRRIERTSFIADSDAYIACFLEPFFRRSNEACSGDAPALATLRASAESLQSGIASLHWALRGAFTRDEMADDRSIDS